MQGNGPYRIAKILESEKVDMPAYHQQKLRYGLHQSKNFEHPFDNIQRIRGNVKRYPDGWGEYHPLTGLMYCADCGSKMYVHRTNNYKDIPYYVCSNYKKVPCGMLCPSAHRIKAEVVLNLIQETLKDIKNYLDEYNEALFIPFKTKWKKRKK